MERYFWLGFNSDGESIVTMSMSNVPPKEMKSASGLSGVEKIYRDFKPISKDEVLLRQRDGLKKLEETLLDREMFREAFK